MQVFKAYFKVINNRKGGLLIFFLIFLLVSISITNALTTANTQAFNQEKSNIAFYSAESTPLADGLKAYLSRHTNIIEVPDTQQEIQDALFYGQISYVLRVPQGFTQSFMSGSNNVNLQKTSAGIQTQSVYTDMTVNRYLNTASLYLKNMPAATQEQIAANVARDMDEQAIVDINTYNKPVDTNNMAYYFQYLGYAIMAIMIMGITSVMMTFSEADLQNRNLCSPVRQTSFNLQLILGNLAFALAVWAALCLIIFGFYGKVKLDTGTLLLCLNALALSLVALSIGFLVGKFIRSHGAQGAVTNVVSLGLSFIGGVFVPQSMLGKSVLDVASFTPGYWYVKAVNDIQNMAAFNAQNITPVLYSIFIQLGFAVALLIVALVVSKHRKPANAYS